MPGNISKLVQSLGHWNAFACVNAPYGCKEVCNSVHMCLCVCNMLQGCAATAVKFDKASLRSPAHVAKPCGRESSIHIFISDIDISAIFHIPRLFPNSLQTAFLDYTGVIRVKLRATIRDPPNSGPSAHLFFFVIFLVQSRGWFSFQRHEKVGRSWLYPPLMWGNCLAMVFSIKITFNHQNPLAKVTLFVLRHGKTRDLAKFQPRLLFLSVGSDHKRFTSIIHKGKRKMMPYGPTKSPNCQLFNHLHQLNNKKVFARMERAICNGALYR